MWREETFGNFAQLLLLTQLQHFVNCHNGPFLNVLGRFILSKIIFLTIILDILGRNNTSKNLLSESGSKWVTGWIVHSNAKTSWPKLPPGLYESLKSL
jgi:hypothetical protein